MTIRPLDIAHPYAPSDRSRSVPAETIDWHDA